MRVHQRRGRDRRPRQPGARAPPGPQGPCAAEIGALAHEAGVADPDGVAAALVLVLEGAIALFGILHDRDGVTAAKDAARTLLAAAAG